LWEDFAAFAAIPFLTEDTGSSIEVIFLFFLQNNYLAVAGILVS
jgi:hypothetical protein